MDKFIENKVKKAEEHLQKQLLLIQKIKSSTLAKIAEAEDIETLKESLLDANNKIWEVILLFMETTMNQNMVIMQFMDAKK